jgi:hypothetical protein
MEAQQAWTSYSGVSTSSQVSRPCDLSDLGLLQFNMGVSSPPKRSKAPRKHLKRSNCKVLSSNEIRDMEIESDYVYQLSRSCQVQQGPVPLTGNSVQAAASSVNIPSVNTPSIHVPSVHTSSSNKLHTQPGSNTIPFFGTPSPSVTPAPPAFTSKDNTTRIAADVGFKPPRPGLTFFFHNGQDWEMLTGQGHLEYTSAYWKWKEAELTSPKAAEGACVIGNVEYVIDWRAMVSCSIDW